MEVEILRRRFLQGSVALTIVGGTAFSASSLLSAEKEKGVNYKQTISTL